MKLGDYGLPILLYSKENGSTLCHAAPEVFDEQRELKSDVWSLGVALFHLGEQKDPFKDVYYHEVQRWLCNNDPPSLSSEKWSVECVDFVGKCLVKDVKERWSVKQLMEVGDCKMAKE